MKKTLFIALTVLVVLTGKAAAQTPEKTVEKVEVGNKICPISGEEVGSMGEIAKYEYKGKIYNLCCLGCEKDFKKDPEAAIKKLEKLEQEALEKKEEHMHHEHEMPHK